MLVLMTLIAFQIDLKKAEARIDIGTTTPVQFPQFAKETDSLDMNQFVPTDIESTNDVSIVFSRIGDQTLQTLMRSPEVQNSRLGRTANSVQNSLKTDVSVKGSAADSVEHKFSLKLLALQAKAKVQYSGLINASAEYDARLRKTILELSQKIWQNKELVISHTKNQTNDMSALGLRWSW